MTTVQDVLKILQSKRRRYALYYLDSQETPVSVTELAEAVAEMVSDGAEDVADETVYRFELALEQSHLPVADDRTEFIDYDADEGVVRLTDEPPEYEAFLTLGQVIEDVG